LCLADGNRNPKEANLVYGISVKVPKVVVFT